QLISVSAKATWPSDCERFRSMGATMNPSESAPSSDNTFDLLGQALIKASDDLTAAHGAIEMARERDENGSSAASRRLIVAATRAIDHLREVDEALSEVLRELELVGEQKSIEQATEELQEIDRFQATDN